jgi:predicted deacetylase
MQPHKPARKDWLLLIGHVSGVTWQQCLLVVPFVSHMNPDPVPAGIFSMSMV